MCFSPEASFAGGIVISSVGVAALRKVRKAQKPSQRLFAGIPLFFGVQQTAEGCVWLALSDPQYAPLHNGGMYLFLFMARVLWPVLMPLAVLLMEEDRQRKKLMQFSLALGSTVSVYYTYCLFFLNVAPHIEGHHIQYISDFPELMATPVFIIYFIASLTPLFVSSNKRTILLGVLLFFSAIVTVIFFTYYLTSVWCFFAAVISGVIYWIVSEPLRNGSPTAVQAEH